MAIRLRPQSNLGNVLSISLSASATENPAQLKITYLNNGNVASTIPSSSSISYGGLTFHGVLVSQSSHYEQGKNYLVREWIDNSITLDQNCIVLFRAGLGGTIGTNYGSVRSFSVPTINVTRTANGGYQYSYGSVNYNTVVERMRAPAGGNIIGEESWGASKCIRSEVTYDPNQALSIIGAPPVINSNGFRCSYEGNYRSVLSSIYGDFGATYWWDWSTNVLNKIDLQSQHRGSLVDWGFGNIAQVSQNCNVFSYDVGSTRVGVSTRSNWLVRKDETNFPKDTQSVARSNKAATRAFYNSMASTSRQKAQAEQQGTPSSISIPVQVVLPPYIFGEFKNTIKQYGFFTVSPLKSPFWPSLSTILYGAMPALKIYDGVTSRDFNLLGYSTAGTYNLSAAANLIEIAPYKNWFVDSLGFDQTRSVYAQLLETLGIDGSYDIYMAFELDGAPDGEGEYELYYPYTAVNYSDFDTDGRYYFKKIKTTFEPETTARGFDRCGSTWQDREGIAQFGNWRQPSTVIDGDTNSAAFGEAVAGCVQQLSNAEIFINIARIVEQANLVAVPSPTSGGRTGSGSLQRGVMSVDGIWVSFSNVSLQSADQIAAAVEDGMTFLAIRRPFAGMSVTFSEAINCGDISDVAGYINPNQLAVRDPRVETIIQNLQSIAESEFGDFQPREEQIDLWEPGTYYIRNPAYRAESSFNQNQGLSDNAGSPGYCDDLESEVPDTITTETVEPEFIAVSTQTEVVPQEVLEYRVDEYTVRGQERESGLTSAVAESITISCNGASVYVTLPTLASLIVTSETDIEEIERFEYGTKYTVNQTRGPDAQDPTPPPEDDTQTNPEPIASANKNAANSWFTSGPISNSAGLSHAVVITDISNLESYQGVPSSLISPSSWLETAEAETDGFYFNVSPGLQSLSANFSSDGNLRVSYSYKQIAQRTAISRVPNSITSANTTDIYL